MNVAALMRTNPTLRGYVVMGALTPEQATEQIFPSAQVRGGAGHNAATRAVILRSATAGQMLNVQGTPAYIPGTGECAKATGQIGGNVRLVQQGTGMALVAAGAFLGPPGILLALVPSIIGLFGSLFTHHSKAVQKEQSTLCAAVPAANNYLAIIDQAVKEGKATPQAGISALQSLVSDFQAQVSGIIHGSDPTSSGECNAACVMLSELRAIAALKSSQYQDLAAAAPMTSGSGPTTAAPSSGATMQLPVTPAGQAVGGMNWLGIAALFGLAFVVAKVL